MDSMYICWVGPYKENEHGVLLLWTGFHANNSSTSSHLRFCHSSLPSPFSLSWFCASDISSTTSVLSHTCKLFTTFIGLFFGGGSASHRVFKYVFGQRMVLSMVKRWENFPLVRNPFPFYCSTVFCIFTPVSFRNFFKPSLEKELKSSPCSPHAL